MQQNGSLANDLGSAPEHVRGVAHGLAGRLGDLRRADRTGAHCDTETCYSAAPPSAISRCINSDGEGASARMTVSSMAIIGASKHIAILPFAGFLCLSPLFPVVLLLL